MDGKNIFSFFFIEFKKTPKICNSRLEYCLKGWNERNGQCELTKGELMYGRGICKNLQWCTWK